MNPPASPDVLPTRTALWVCLAFAAAYFISTLLRAITATLAPVLSAEWQLQARDLGLLASGYFVGFSAVQLPMGRWLDRYGPKRVITLFLSVAVLGCVAFATAEALTERLIENPRGLLVVRDELPGWLASSAKTRRSCAPAS